MKKYKGVILPLIGWLVCTIIGCYMLFNGTILPRSDGEEDATRSDNITKQLLLPGEVFERGKYIEVDGTEILYDGEHFRVKNNRTDIVRVSCSIVGVKKDGSYDTIQLPSFAGVDKTRYDRDKAENGWAIEQYTNLIRPDETLEAVLTIFDFNEFDDSYPKNDIDNDGYLDIVFTISPQLDETSIRVSTDDIKSDIYKIKEK